MTCAGAVVLKGHMHVKKEKAGNGVCGAAGKGGAAHAKKKKARNNVCGAAPAIRSHPQKGTSTRHPQKSHNNNKK